MITIRRSEERGHFDHGWLDTYHTFSFGDYRDPDHMVFRVLRVLNEDWVKGGQGFPPHPHRDMEIITYVLEGALAHQDSMGNGSVIRPGEVQRMSAGTGVVHSEANADRIQPVHLLQIWILPERRGIEPGYEQKAFPAEERRGKLRVVASPDGRQGSVNLHQDVVLHATLLEPGERAAVPLAPERHAWVQVASGEIEVNGTPLARGDGAALSGESEVAVTASAPAEVLVFDLP